MIVSAIPVYSRVFKPEKRKEIKICLWYNIEVATLMSTTPIVWFKDHKEEPINNNYLQDVILPMSAMMTGTAPGFFSCSV